LRFFLLIWLLFVSLVSIGADFSAVEGEFRLQLPKQFSSAQVTFSLKELVKGNWKQTLATQIENLNNGQRKTILLKYAPDDINSKRQYVVDVVVRDNGREHGVLSKGSFPLQVSVSGQFDDIYIAIKVPAEPFE